MRKNRHLIMAMAVILAIATAIGGATFAWFTAYDSRENKMSSDQLSNGDVKVAEVFNKDDPFNPGVDINKDVWAVNTGNVDALVRISFHELLTLLDNNGVAADGGKVWDNTGATAGTIPQLFNADALTGFYSDWDELDPLALPSGLTIDSGSLPFLTGVKVLYKAYPVVETGGTQYEFVAYGEISAPGTAYDGKLQNVTADFEIVDGDLAIDNWSFAQFEKDTPIEYNWLTDPTFPSALIGTLPRVEAFSDPEGFIELVFTDKVKDDLSLCVLRDWWYNAADGYFYYIGIVAPGQATTQLLDAVGLKADATSAYCLLDYQLTVDMWAVQALEEALSSSASGGWGLSGSTLDDLAALLFP